MNKKDFPDAATEVLEILKYLPHDKVEKIPKEFLEFLEKYSNKNFVTKIDPNKPLDMQEITETTKDIITIIYRNCWCNAEEKKKLDKKILENDRKYEKILRNKYNPNEIF